jgi:hypothetical protein
MIYIEAGSDLETSRLEIALKCSLCFHISLIVIIPDASCELLVVEVWFVS